MAHKFKDIESIETPSHMIILGSTISGKTCFLRYMLSIIKDRFAYGVLFSSTVGFNDDYDFIPSRYQYQNFDPEVIKELIEIQRKNLNKLNRKYANSSNRRLEGDEIKKKLPNAIVILDDTSGILDRTRECCQDIEWLITTGRHLNISVIMVLQDFTMVSPVIRKNTRYYFITKVNGSTYKHLSETCKGFTTKELKNLLETHCVDYNVVCFDTHGIASAENSRFKIRPPHPNKVEKFRIES